MRVGIGPSYLRQFPRAGLGRPVRLRDIVVAVAIYGATFGVLAFSMPDLVLDLLAAAFDAVGLERRFGSYSLLGADTLTLATFALGVALAGLVVLAAFAWGVVMGARTLRARRTSPIYILFGLVALGVGGLAYASRPTFMEAAGIVTELPGTIQFIEALNALYDRDRDGLAAIVAALATFALLALGWRAFAWVALTGRFGVVPLVIAGASLAAGALVASDPFLAALPLGEMGRSFGLTPAAWLYSEQFFISDGMAWLLAVGTAAGFAGALTLTWLVVRLAVSVRGSSGGIVVAALVTLAVVRLFPKLPLRIVDLLDTPFGTGIANVPLRYDEPFSSVVPSGWAWALALGSSALVAALLTLCRLVSRRSRPADTRAVARWGRARPEGGTA